MIGRGVGPAASVGEYFHVSLHTDKALRTQVDIVLTSIVAYNVDAVRSHSAEVISGHS